MWGTAAGDKWKLWTFPVSNFGIPWIFWISGCNRFPCHFFLMIGPRSWFKKVQWLLTFLLRQVSLSINLPRYASFSLTWELDAASGLEFLLSLASGFSWNSEDLRAFGCNRTFRGWGTCQNISRQVQLCKFWFLPQFFLLLSVPASSSPSFWSSLSSWNS